MVPALSMVISCIALLPATAHANLLLNGDFETGNFAPWVGSGTVSVVPGSAYVAGAGATGSFPTGSYAAVFGGGNQPATGLITQNFATVIGQQYLLTFDYGKFNPTPDAQVIQATVNNVSNGATLSTLTVNDFSGATALGSLFSPYSQSFIATGLLTSVSFRDLSPASGSTDGFLDNVGINAVTPNAVPEPNGYLLFVAGLMALVTTRRLMSRRK